MSDKKRFDSAAFAEAYHCDAPMGAFCGENGTLFHLWAPTAQAVTLHLYHEGGWGEPWASIALWRAERGLWRYEDSRNLDGVYYDYSVTVDGVTRRTGDPYARACGVNGWRSMVIDLARTNPDGWAQDAAPPRQAEDVIYEVHVKDFSWDASGGVSEGNRGKFLAFCEGDTSLDGAPTCLAHIRSLGVTHVELMPAFDYGSVDESAQGDAFNWGYDPVNYNVPEGSYASDPYHGEVRIREMKEAVAALHRNGLRVIMDVVYNHTYALDSCLFKTVPWYYYRQTPRGKASNGSGCGSETASERSMCARYILDSVLYWAEEYHIDGFRFDLMGLHDVGLMNRIRKALDKRFGRGEKLLFGEPWAGGKPHPRAGTRLAHKGNLGRLHPGVAAFCDLTRDAVKGNVFDARAGGFVSGGAFSAEYLACCVRGWVGCGEGFPVKAPSQTISYLSCHDNLTLWDKLTQTLDERQRYDAWNPYVLRANRLAAAILFCCQGHLFMLSGEEFGRTKLGDGNSYRSPVALNRMDWRRAQENQELVAYYRGLIALRKQLPAFCDKSDTAHERLLEVCTLDGGVAGILLDNAGAIGRSRKKSPYRRILLAVNPHEHMSSIPLPPGRWQMLADGTSSFLWQAHRVLEGSAPVEAVSALILGECEGPAGK